MCSCIEMESIHDVDSINLQVEINDLFAKSEIIQVYQNGNDIKELYCLFPIKRNRQITKFTAKIGDKIIKSKIYPKEKAEEKYNDTIASGNYGLISEYDSSLNNIQISLSNIQPNEKCILTTEYFSFIESSDMSYQYNLIQNFPVFLDLNEKEEKK